MCAIAAAALWYFQGGSVWYTGGFPGPWPLLLLLVGFTSHLAHVRFRIRAGVIDIALWVFVATALLGVWVAYDLGPAMAKFWLIVGAIGLYYALSHQAEGLPRYLAYAFIGVLGVGLSVYFYLTNDWSGSSDKLPWLYALSKQFARIVPSLASHRMHPNVVGGMLAMLIPFYIPLIKSSHHSATQDRQPQTRRGLTNASYLWFIPLALCLVTLFFSASRGAWVSLIIMTALWMAWRVLGGWLRRNSSRTVERQWRLRLTITGVVVAIGVIGAIIVGLAVLMWQLPGSGALTSRLKLLQYAVPLARDYVFTGAGLGMFQLQLSIYTLLIHASYIVHSHNVLLNVLIEQGLAGLLSFGVIVVSGLARSMKRLREANPRASWLVEAAIASFGVILIHGMVDDVLYGSRGLLLLFVPLGLISAVRTSTTEPQVVRWKIGISERFFRLSALIAILIGLISGAFIFVRPLRAALYANLGAVGQSRTELGVYGKTQFSVITIDQVRQQAELSNALYWFDQSLRYDDGNVTSRQRLAMITMARGQYTEALTHMQSAWEAGHRDNTTRMLLGDAYIANGRPDLAYDVVIGLPWAASRLALQASFRYAMMKDYQRAADTWKVVVLLAPDDASAANALRAAEQRIQQQR